MATPPTLLAEVPTDWPDWPELTQRRLVALLGAAQRVAECKFHGLDDSGTSVAFESAVVALEVAQLASFDRAAIVQVTREIADGHTKHDFETCPHCQLVVLESYVFSQRTDSTVIKIPAKLFREAMQRLG